MMILKVGFVIKAIEDWNTLFLHKAIDNVWETLKPKGLLMVNISDVNTTSKGTKGGKQWLKICDPMNEHLSKKANAEYVECFRNGNGKTSKLFRNWNCGRYR